MTQKTKLVANVILPNIFKSKVNPILYITFFKGQQKQCLHKTAMCKAQTGRSTNDIITYVAIKFLTLKNCQFMLQ